MIQQAKEKMRQQASEAKHPLSEMLSMQIMDNITTSERAMKVLEESKSLEGCQKELDKFAASRKSGGQSFIRPDEAEKLICEYFGFDTVASGVVDKPGKVINVLDFM